MTVYVTKASPVFFTDGSNSHVPDLDIQSDATAESPWYTYGSPVDTHAEATRLHDALVRSLPSNTLVALAKMLRDTLVKNQIE